MLQVTGGGIDKKDIVGEKMTAEEVRKYFESYYKYLKENNLEREFKTLHFLKKENAIEELKKLNNPKRSYLNPLLEMDMKKVRNYAINEER